MTVTGDYLSVLLECGALARQIANRDSLELDERPFVEPAHGPWCADYGRRTGRTPEIERAYLATLEQLGMRFEGGRWFITRPANNDRRVQT